MHHTPGRCGWLALGAAVAVVAASGCSSCGSMAGGEGPVPYVRCGRAEVPDEAQWSVAGLQLHRKGRTLTIGGKSAVRLAAFEGPVGAPLGPAEVALLSAQKPDLAIQLGGLGDDEAMARATLSALSALPFPVLFLPGGADRWPVVEEAFEALDEADRSRRILLAGYRRLELPGGSWAVVPGAPEGRYAIDDEACGFGPADVEEVAGVFADPAASGPPRRLLSWAAPSGWGLTAGLGRLELGSPDLHILAEAIGAEGGLFAFPRGEGSGILVSGAGPERWMVPRLGAGGSVAADGAYREPGVALLSLGP